MPRWDEELAKRWASSQVPLLADGAMGTYLYELGCSREKCLEALALEAPLKLERVHTAYREAGAQVLRTNTFGANRIRLKKYGLEKRTREVIAAACASLHAAREGCAALGSVGPTGLAAREHVAEVAIAYDEVMEAFVRGGVEGIFLETFTSFFEAQLAIRSCVGICGLPFAVFFSSTESLTLSDGVPVAQALEQALQMGAACVGLNCVSPKLFAKLLKEEPELAEAPLGFLPSRGVPQRGTYPLSDEELVAELLEVALNLVLVGGCCGTTPGTIAQLSQRLA